MTSAKRIFIVTIVLLGGVSLFGLWSYNQINVAFDSVTSLRPQIASVVSVVKKIEPEGVIQIATTTVLENVNATSSTSALQSTSTVVGTTTEDSNLNMSFVYPVVKSELYQGCTYQITWTTKNNIKNVDMALVDGGSQKKITSGTSGLSTLIVLNNEKTLMWKVGNVWPGKYFFLVSGINDIVVKIKSFAFNVNSMPDKASVSQKKAFCQEAGGDLI